MGPCGNYSGAVAVAAKLGVTEAQVCLVVSLSGCPCADLNVRPQLGFEIAKMAMPDVGKLFADISRAKSEQRMTPIMQHVRVRSRLILSCLDACLLRCVECLQQFRVLSELPVVRHWLSKRNSKPSGGAGAPAATTPTAASANPLVRMESDGTSALGSPFTLSFLLLSFCVLLSSYPPLPPLSTPLLLYPPPPPLPLQVALALPLPVC